MTAPPPSAASGMITDESVTTQNSRNGKQLSTQDKTNCLEWERSVQKKLVKILVDRSLLEAHAEWAEYLARRPAVKNLVERMGGKRSPLLWGLPVSVLDEQALEWVELLHASARGRLVKSADIETAGRAWLMGPHSASASDAIIAMAWAYALPALAKHVDGDVWWQLFHRLRELIADSSVASFSAESLSGQIYGAELPRVFAYQFPELASARAMSDVSRRTLSESLPELLDGQGAPHARHLTVFRALFACWTRCAHAADAGRDKCWNRSAATQYAWLVTQSMRMARHDGSQALANEPTFDGPQSKSLFQAALRIGGNKVDRLLATIALPGVKAKTNPAEWDAPSAESEWAEFAILRKDWSRKSPQLLVAFDAGNTIVELTHGKRMIWQGLHGFAAAVDGREVHRRSDSSWQLVCWESDDDVDYLELEMELERGVRVQRSYLLMREDEALLVNDVVLTPGAGKVRYRTELPLADDVIYAAEQETRDGWLASDKRLARVLPLALPEWRVDPRAGNMFVEDGALVLEQESLGAAIMVPIFLDLNRRRQEREGTWRQLTVAEERRVQPNDVAVGFRAQVGSDQWLVYRSLAPVALRTVLGQHLSMEFYCGRFDEDGEAEQLLAVE